MHHSWDPAEIIADLKRQNLKAVSATNKMQYKTKKPLDMFLVSFEACEEIRKVPEIRSILNTIVNIEPKKAFKTYSTMQSLSKFWAHPELLW